MSKKMFYLVFFVVCLPGIATGVNWTGLGPDSLWSTGANWQNSAKSGTNDSVMMNLADNTCEPVEYFGSWARNKSNFNGFLKG